MNLIKTSFYTIIATIIKILSSLILNKAMSIYVGPSGLALVGQLQNSLQLISVLAQGGINSGVTKYTAEYHNQNQLKHFLWSTSFKITITCSAFVGAFLIIFSNVISQLTLNDVGYQYLFITFGITIVLFSVNQLLLSIINGLQEIKFFIITNIIQNLFTLFYTVTLIYLFSLDGVLFALVTNQSFVLIIILLRLWRYKLLDVKVFFEKFNKSEAKKLSHFSFMTFVSIFSVPVSHLLVRDNIATTISLSDAGYWQSIWYISSIYLMVITTSLSIYYLPKLSEIKDTKVLKNEILSAFKIVIPIVMIGSSAIYILRDLIINIAFTADFLPMRALFKWQMIGDVIRACSWILSYLMLAKSMTKSFVVSEIFFAITFTLLSFFLIDEFGLIGVTYAYTINSLMYLMVVYFITRKTYS